MAVVPRNSSIKAEPRARYRPMGPGATSGWESHTVSGVDCVHVSYVVPAWIPKGCFRKACITLS